jgi:hypothetical protein
MNQRANGEGSIYRRADGRWTAACYVLRPDGTRVRRSVYGKTRKDVADQLVILIAKTKAGLPIAVESWTLERFAEHWLKHVVGPVCVLRHSRATARRCVCMCFRRSAA